jgi:beta-glucosidase
LVGYIHKPSEGSGNPQGGETSPQYSFGFGLSYTNFSYSNLTVNKTNFGTDESVTVSVTVTNTGSRPGKEVVQLFISDLIASALTPDVRRLRGFDKVMLNAAESKRVEFKIAVKDLAFVAPDNKKHLEQGDFKVQVGNLNATFAVNKSRVF